MPFASECPICSAMAERTGRSTSRVYYFTCPACGTFAITRPALACRAVTLSARQDIRLNSFGHTPQIELVREGLRVVPGKRAKP